MALKVIELRTDGRLTACELRCLRCGHPTSVRTAEDVEQLRALALGLLEVCDRMDADRLPAVPTPAHAYSRGERTP
jgi:hypothetical protein